MADGRVVRRTNNAISADRFEDSAASSPQPASTAANSAVTSAAASASASAANSGAEDQGGELKFKAKKKKKLTRAQLKERDTRRRLRHLAWYVPFLFLIFTLDRIIY